MLAIYNKASICAFERPFDCGLKLQPDLKGIMARSRDWDELLYVWGEWRRKSGENMKELYEQLIELTNEAAQYNSMCSTFTIHMCFASAIKCIFRFRFHYRHRVLDIPVRIEWHPTGCGKRVVRNIAIV